MSSEPRLICPQCGHDNPHDFLICGQCGADLLIEPVDQDLDISAVAEKPDEQPIVQPDIKAPNKAHPTPIADDEMARIQEEIRKSSKSGFVRSLSTSIEWNFNLGNIAIIAWIVVLLIFATKYFMNRAEDIPLGLGNQTNKSVQTNNVTNSEETSSTDGLLIKKFELPAGAIKAIVKDVKSAEVIEVIDPEKETSAQIRLIGVDAPEAYPNNSSENGAVQAYQYLSQRIKGKEIGLLYGETRTEIGVPWKPRSFAYIYFEGEMINLELITKGLVILGDPAPETKYYQDFIQAQNVAKKERIGLWAD